MVVVWVCRLPVVGCVDWVVFGSVGCPVVGALGVWLVLGALSGWQGREARSADGTEHRFSCMLRAFSVAARGS